MPLSKSIECTCVAQIDIIDDQRPMMLLADGKHNLAGCETIRVTEIVEHLANVKSSNDFGLESARSANTSTGKRYH